MIKIIAELKIIPQFRMIIIYSWKNWKNKWNKNNLKQFENK